MKSRPLMEIPRRFVWEEMGSTGVIEKDGTVKILNETGLLKKSCAKANVGIDSFFGVKEISLLTAFISVDVYDEPQEEEQHDDQAADDRIAEQFRREFLDAIQSRRRFARARNTKTTKTTAPRGPKLGGSRSARAAMREKQDKSAQK